MAKRIKFSDQIRQAVRDSGLTQYRICKEIEINESTMSYFMGTKRRPPRWLGVENMDALAELLGLNVTAEKKPGKEKER